MLAAFPCRRACAGLFPGKEKSAPFKIRRSPKAIPNLTPADFRFAQTVMKKRVVGTLCGLWSLTPVRDRSMVLCTESIIKTKTCSAKSLYGHLKIETAIAQ